MNKVLEQLILALLDTNAIFPDTANKLLAEIGSKYPGYTPDQRNVYDYLKDSAVTAETLNNQLGIDEITLSRMVKAKFLVKTADSKYRVA